MLPIHVMWDSGVNEFEASAIVEGLEELLLVFPNLDIVVYGCEPWCEGEYSSCDWYVDHTATVMNGHGYVQLLADDLLDLVDSEPWRDNSHIDVIFTSNDLTAYEGGSLLNFVFGVAWHNITVQSVARYRSLPLEDRAIAIKAVIHHELGHIFGMAMDLSRPNTIYKLGQHCTNPGCVMRQAMSVSELVNHSRESRQLRMIYCPQCLNDAKANGL